MLEKFLREAKAAMTPLAPAPPLDSDIDVDDEPEGDRQTSSHKPWVSPGPTNEQRTAFQSRVNAAREIAEGFHDPQLRFEALSAIGYTQAETDKAAAHQDFLAARAAAAQVSVGPSRWVRIWNTATSSLGLSILAGILAFAGFMLKPLAEACSKVFASQLAERLGWTSVSEALEPALLHGREENDARVARRFSPEQSVVLQVPVANPGEPAGPGAKRTPR